MAARAEDGDGGGGGNGGNISRGRKKNLYFRVSRWEGRVEKNLPSTKLDNGERQWQRRRGERGCGKKEIDDDDESEVKEKR